MATPASCPRGSLPGRHAHGPASSSVAEAGASGLVRAEACADTPLLFLLDDIAPSGRTAVPAPHMGCSHLLAAHGLRPSTRTRFRLSWVEAGTDLLGPVATRVDRLNRQTVSKASHFEDKGKEAERSFCGSAATRPVSRGPGGSFHARTGQRGGLRGPEGPTRTGDEEGGSGWFLRPWLGARVWPGPHALPEGPGGDPRHDPALGRLSGRLPRPCQALALLGVVERRSPSSPRRRSSPVPLTPCPHKATWRHTVRGGCHSLVNKITRVNPAGPGTQTLRRSVTPRGPGHPVLHSGPHIVFGG